MGQCDQSLIPYILFSIEERKAWKWLHHLCFFSFMRQWSSRLVSLGASCIGSCRCILQGSDLSRGGTPDSGGLVDRKGTGLSIFASFCQPPTADGAPQLTHGNWHLKVITCKCKRWYVLAPLFPTEHKHDDVSLCVTFSMTYISETIFVKHRGKQGITKNIMLLTNVGNGKLRVVNFL